MSIITNIKQSIGNYFLKKEITFLRRNRQMFNIQEARNIAIIIDATNRDDFELLKKYVAYLREMKKKVKVLGFFSQGEVPNITYSKLEYEFFTPKELNWYLKPLSKYIDNFIEEEYDILIDLNLSDSFPLKYVATTSRAKFKIGKFNDLDISVYDMMIKAEAGKGLKYFMRQVDSYLQMINNTAPPIAVNE